MTAAVTCHWWRRPGWPARRYLDDLRTPGTLPEGPTIVATKLSAAARLLERRLDWPGTRTALLDVVTAPGGNWPSIVADVRADLATCCMIERETAVEPG